MLRKIMLFVFFSLLMVSYSYADKVFYDTEGHPVQLTKLKDKWIVVNYWASWCPGCMEEVPELNRFYQNNHKDVLIYGVNFDRLPKESLRRTISRTNIAFPVLLEDPKFAWRLKSIVYLPTTFILNPQGEVVKTIVGPSTEHSLLSAIERLQEHPPMQASRKHRSRKIA